MRRLPAVFRVRFMSAILSLVIASGALNPLVAQQPADSSQPSSGGLRWWHGALAVGGFTALTLLDNPVHRFIQDNRSGTSNDVASVFRHFGQPEAYATASLGLLAAGLISGNRSLTNAGIRVTSAVALTGGLVYLGKYSFGRARPSEAGRDADDYYPFSGRGSMPSGHSAIAFSLATALSDEIRNTWATVGLYALATGTAYSRLNDNDHWFSDVVAGAAVGFISAKFATGRMSVFGIRAPSFIPRQGGVSVGWSHQF